ncbi:hypothetical protein V1525DRAFT_387124 [Lipomyces kononenkoae]|uniref:Uncharacterized protein n=1 Tax=Lipomyces kononenkoae TaxID=34357 RepID=A0ACC3T4T8_LIPKO
MAAQTSTPTAPILQRADFDFLPDLLELFERVCDGSLQPKDLHNEAGRLRIRISRARSLLTQVVVADDGSVGEQTAIIEELKDKIAKKRYLLSKVAELGKAILQREGELQENELVFEAEKKGDLVKEETDVPQTMEISEVELVPQPVELFPESQHEQIKQTDDSTSVESAPKMLPQVQEDEQPSNDVLQFDNNDNGGMDNGDIANWGQDFDMTGEVLKETIESLPGDAQMFGEADVGGGEDNDMQEFMQMMQESGMEGQGDEFANNQNDDGDLNQQDSDVMFIMINEIPSGSTNTEQKNPGDENMGGTEEEVQIDELAKAMAEGEEDVIAQLMPMDVS